MKITVGKPHFWLPGYFYALTRNDLPESISVADDSRQSHRFEIRDLAQLANNEEATLEVRRGDIFVIEIEAVEPKHVEWLEGIAQVGAEDWTIALIPWSRCLERDKSERSVPADEIIANRGDVESDAAYLSRQIRSRFPQADSYFREFQAVRLDGINRESIRELIASLNRMNYRSTRDGLINLFSLLYLLGSLMFGVTAPLVCIAILVARWYYGSVGWWGALTCFLAGPSVYAWICGRLNWIGLIPLCSLVWFACEAVADRNPNGVLLLPVVVVAMVAFVIFNRLREYMDARDLLKCVFSREICDRNPGFQIPERMPSFGSGEFILWRLGRLNVWRFFDAYTLSRVFITHRNSHTGLVLTEAISEALDEDWEVYFDRRNLKSGIWREQLADGFYGTGVLICILTPEDRSQLPWIRRELAAASLRYAAYATPIPIIVEAGMTLEDVLKEDDEAGRLNTPIHHVKDRLQRVRWSEIASTLDGDQAAKSDNLARLRRRLRSAVEAELAEQVPVLINEGVSAQCSRLFVPAMLTVVAGAYWLELWTPVFRNIVVVALVVLCADLGGLSLGRLLPRWLGGLDRRTAWLGKLRSTVRPIPLLLTFGLIVWVLASNQWDNAFKMAIAVGLSINLLDHELWQAGKLRRVLAPADALDERG